MATEIDAPEYMMLVQELGRDNAQAVVDLKLRYGDMARITAAYSLIPDGWTIQRKQ